MNENEFINSIANHTNTSSEIELLRNTFLTSEYEYLKHLLSSESIRELLYNLNKIYDPEKLYHMAMERINAIENGEVKEKKLSEVEGEITLLLAAISDKELINELILYYSSKEEQEEKNVRSR